MRTLSIPLSFLLAACLASLGCGKKQDAATAPVTAATASGPPAAAPTTAAAPSSSTHAAPAGAPAKGAKCATGTVAAFVGDADRSKCLPPCDGTDAACPHGQTCTQGNGVGDDGNPIQHDVINVCIPPAAGAKPPAAAPKTAAAPPPGTMEMANPGHPPCPTGYDDEGGVLDTCNKSCKAPKDCKAPFTCTSVTGDPTKICVDSKHLHTR